MNDTHRAPQDKVCGYEYTVRRGDSFYLIANRLGVPLRDLLEANSDINPARLMVGDVLCIPMEEDDAPVVPETPSAPEAPAEPNLPTEPDLPVEPDLPAAPDLPADDDLDTPAVPGQGGNATSPAPSTPACPNGTPYTVAAGETTADIQLRTNVNRYSLQNANPAADLDRLTAGQTLCIPPQNMACPEAATYRLQAEDTIESTALRLNTSLAALLRANPCLAPSDFVPGRCIWVPEA